MHLYCVNAMFWRYLTLCNSSTLKQLEKNCAATITFNMENGLSAIAIGVCRVNTAVCRISGAARSFVSEHARLGSGKDSHYRNSFYSLARAERHIWIQFDSDVSKVVDSLVCHKRGKQISTGFAARGSYKLKTTYCCFKMLLNPHALYVCCLQ